MKKGLEISTLNFVMDWKFTPFNKEWKMGHES